MTGAACGVNSESFSAVDDSKAVTFSIVSLANAVMRIEVVGVCALGDAEADAELEGRERLAYPLTHRQLDAIREAFSLAGIVGACSPVAVFDGFCRAVAPGVVLYTVWLTG